jgi:molybdopterin/thiamine biosynthesis adenylyltransferase
LHVQQPGKGFLTMSYEELFNRNQGILSPMEQEKLRTARLLVVGCGGVGGTVALSLARTGLEHFTLIDFDTYSSSNINRQMGATQSTLGKYKSAVLGEQILDINPQTQVNVFTRKLSHAELIPHLEQCDLVFAAADDYAFSLVLVRHAKKAGCPCLVVFPSGLWGLVTLVQPDSPALERLFHLPPGMGYQPLYQILHSRLFLSQFKPLSQEGSWLPDYFNAYAQGKAPVTQICPFVWLAASRGALEAVKQLSGKMTAISFPHYWKLTADGTSRESL